MKVKKALILSAGLGTRLLPLTKKIPKPLVKINGVTLLENSIKFLSSLGVKHIVINSHQLYGKIINFIKSKKFLPRITEVVEKVNIFCFKS